MEIFTCTAALRCADNDKLALQAKKIDQPGRPIDGRSLPTGGQWPVTSIR